MKEKVWGPFRLYYGRTRWNEKIVAVGVGKQLRAYAKERGIGLTGKTLKDDIIAAIRAAL